MNFLTSKPESARAHLAARCATEWYDLTPELAREWFTADCLYENRIATPTRVTGPEAIYQTLDEYRGRCGRFEGTLLNIAETGDVVLLERDELTYLKSGVRCNVPVMDSFQFRGDQIFAWREYWDLATLTNYIDESF